MFKNYMRSELIRYKKRPYFWTVAFSVSAGMLYKMWMDLKAEKYNV